MNGPHELVAKDGQRAQCGGPGLCRWCTEGVSGQDAMNALLRLVAVGRKLNMPRAAVLEALQDLDEDTFGVVSAALADAEVQMLGKALALALDHERTVVDTRVLSDIRPVLADSSEIVVMAATLEHALRLTYVEDGQLVDRQFAMKAADLVKLRAQLDRTLRVDAVLADICEGAGMEVAG